jgi:Mitochondrial carrier protein
MGKCNVAVPCGSSVNLCMHALAVVLSVTQPAPISPIKTISLSLSNLPLLQFYTYNFLNESEWMHKMIPSSLLRNAGIGMVASVVSDTVVNAIRVVKTTKQAIGSRHTISYTDTIQLILTADGYRGFGRGLSTRILANGLQSILFTVVWRGLAEAWSNKREEYRSKKNR